MIEREKKRIKLERKYALKRSTLLQKYQKEDNKGCKCIKKVKIIQHKSKEKISKEEIKWNQ